jgi:hypothetical protein
MRVDTRLLTTIAILGACGFAVARGWNIVHFSVAMANGGSSEKRAQIINKWIGAPAVASTALQAALTEINSSDVKAANSSRETLSLMLSIKPLSSGDWLLLSGTQFATDQPIDQVLGSLKLSMLAGPNEGYLMAERGIFGASIWDRLSPDLKTRVAVDLVAADISGRDKIRDALSAEPERVWKEIQEILLANGLSQKEIDQRLGF